MQFLKPHGDNRGQQQVVVVVVHFALVLLVEQEQEQNEQQQQEQQDRPRAAFQEIGNRQFTLCNENALFVCAACGAPYCSDRCHAVDWQRHIRECKQRP